MKPIETFKQMENIAIKKNMVKRSYPRASAHTGKINLA